MSRLRFPGKTYGDWKIVFPPQTTRHCSWWIVCRQEDILIANWTRKSFYGISQNRLHKTFNKIYPRRCNFRLLLPSTRHPRRSILFYNAFIKSKNVPFNWSFAPKENHAKKEDFLYTIHSLLLRDPIPQGHLCSQNISRLEQWGSNFAKFQLNLDCYRPAIYLHSTQQESSL